MQNENLNMYQLGYEPTRLDDFNDYFLQYLKTNDSKYFNKFLHFYEPILNRKATEFIEHNHIEEYRLPDLKQIFVSLLWTNCKDIQQMIRVYANRLHYYKYGK